MSTGTSGPSDEVLGPATTASNLDVERDSDVPISTQIYWQLAYQIDSGRLLPGARLAPVREMGAALRVNPNTIRAVYRRRAPPRHPERDPGGVSAARRRRLRNQPPRGGDARGRPAAGASWRGGAGRDRRRDAPPRGAGGVRGRRGRGGRLRRGVGTQAPRSEGAGPV